MADLSVIWEDSALKLLETRDRYTRNMIREEFRREPEKDAIELDPEKQSFLTPVSNNRFIVVWRRDGERILVQAVVPLPNLDQVKTLPSASKKAYIDKVVSTESKGEIAL
jgi:hypothetical protein